MNTPNPENWARLSPMLDELLDLPEPQRLDRLDVLRQDHPALSDELAALLADSHSAHVKGFLAKPLVRTADDASEAHDNSLAGQRLGPYVLEFPLGQGGTGSVGTERLWKSRSIERLPTYVLNMWPCGRAGA